MMYIIMDLDDTLLRNDKSISEFTLNILKKCADLGHIIVFNTARNFLSTKKYIDIVKPHYSILNGGGLILQGNTIILSSFIDIKTTNEIINLIKDDKKVISFSIESSQGLFSSDRDYPKHNPLATYYDFTTPLDLPSYKILFSTNDTSIAKNIAKQYHLDFTHYLGGNWYRLAKEDKNSGMELLFKYLKDNNPQTICFGDDIGDLKMLEHATIGVAMLNSQKPVLKKITNITKETNDNNGIAHYLLELIEKGVL